MPPSVLRPSALALAFGIGAAACATLRGAPAPAEDAAGSPLSVARAFYGALHGGDAPRAAALVASPHAARAAEAFVAMAKAYQSVEDALHARFGPEVEGVGFAARVAAERAALREATATVEGDRATVTGRGGTLATLRRVGGAWKVTLDDALASEEGIMALASEAEASWRAAERVAPAIRAGRFDTADDALQTFRNELAMAGANEVRDRAAPPAEDPQTAEPAPLPVDL